uniref:Uncharacterized protein n=1 Tax=Panagrolaimus sp. JU765 TaxID=591449 RepID=A0AC34QIR0_9BILA
MKSEEPKSKTALIFTLILLICSLSINVWLKQEYEYIKQSSKKCMTEEAVFDYSVTRTKRDVHLEITQHDGDYFLPLYTHLNPKEIDKLCANRYDMVHQNQETNEVTNDVAFQGLKASEDNKKKEKNRTKWKSNRSKKVRGKHFGHKMPKSCPPISSLLEPSQLGSRLYEVGTALRLDDKVFVTEQKRPVPSGKSGQKAIVQAFGQSN